jgi:hypothetical protein
LFDNKLIPVASLSTRGGEYYIGLNIIFIPVCLRIFGFSLLYVFFIANTSLNVQILLVLVIRSKTIAFVATW